MTIELTTKGEELLGWLPRHFHDDFIVQGLIDVFAKEVERLDADWQETFMQLFAMTATWGLKYWEMALQLPVEPTGFDTGAIEMDVDATAGTFTRATGSFLDDGMTPGSYVSFEGFSDDGNNVTRVIDTVTDTVITVVRLDTGAIEMDVDATAGTFTRATGSFLADGALPGRSVTFSGFTEAGNNTTKVIESVTSTVLTVSDNTGLVDESGDGDEVALGATSLVNETGDGDERAYYTIDIEQRRTLVMTKLNANIVESGSQFRAVLDSIVSSYQISMDHDTATLVVEITFDEESGFGAFQIEKIVQSMTPAHILLSASYEGGFYADVSAADDPV